MSRGQLKKEAKEKSLDLKAEIDALKRQFEIEAALEKVRVRTMEMRSSDELPEVALVLWEQLEQLNLKGLDGCAIHVNDETGTFEGWSAFPDFTDGERKMKLDRNRHDQRCIWVWKEWDRYYRAGETSFSVKCNKKQLNELIDWFAPFYPGFAKEMRSLSLDKLYVNGVAFSNGILGGSSVEPLTEDTWSAFKRLTAVFDMAYKRCEDLQKAEQQAREAQIEAALERVRARTMAMHKGDELADTSLLLFEQITELGIKPRSCGFLIMDEETKSMEDWSANLNEKGKASLVTGTLAFDQHPMISEVVATWRKGAPYFIGEIHGRELQKYYRAVTSKESTSKAIQDKVLSKSLSEWTNSFYFEYGMMYVLTPYAICKDEIDILLRFAGVFKLTYCRFLDLKKAEEQAREAEIELALERVRARAMAMHKSEELAEAAELLYRQLGELGIDAWTCGYVFIEEDENQAKVWMTEPDGKFFWGLWSVPLSEEKVLKDRHESWKRKEKIHRSILKGQDNIDHHIYIAEHSPMAVDDFLSILPVDIVLTSAHFSYGYLIVVSETLLSNKQENLLVRFAKVFELTYTRFLDLKKAEEQARESEIELALERVRARAMAMHNSEELYEIAKLLYKQLHKLGIDSFSCGYVLIDEEEGQAKVWMTNPEGGLWTVPLSEERVLKDRHQSWKRKDLIHRSELAGQDLNAHLTYIAENSPLTPAEIKVFLSTHPNHLVLTSAHFSHGYLLVVSEPPVTGEDESMLIRFAQVFELTYKRYLDLTKAEKQAQEARVEVALERVRARTMAMQHSNELADASLLLAQQVKGLGIETWGCAFHIYDEDSKSATEWFSNHEATLPTYKLEMENIFLEYYRAGLKGESLYIKTFEGKGCEKHYQYLCSLPVVGEALLDMKAKGIPFPTFQIDHVAYFKYGHLLFITFKQLPEAHEIFKRFAAVFEQTYTRFLDLKKAEEQAREAEIEAALERVRARALAMHSSDEILEVADVLREQMGLLGQPELAVSAVHIYTQGAETFDSWWAFIPRGKSKRKILTGTSTFSIKTSVLAQEFVHRYESKQGTYTIYASGKELKEWQQELAVLAPRQIKSYRNQLPEEQYFHFSDFSGGSLAMVSYQEPSQESKDLQKRSAAVFNLAYQRFLDLKNAEAKAREAQIEAALERVRAKAMAMHSSEDVGKATMVLFQELENLGIETIRCGVAIIDENQTMEAWASSTFNGNVVFNVAGMIDMTIHPLLKRLFREWKSGAKVFTYELKGKDAERYYHAIRKLPSYKLPDIDDISQKHYSTGFLFKEGALFAFSKEQFTEEHSQIFQKFTNVFTLTYRRYLDLKEAEARASAAVLKSSLDRVRAEIASMRTTDDLQHITPLVWRELRSLGVPFFRCGVFIMDEANETVHMYLSTPTGEPLAAMDLGFDEKEIPMVQEAIDHWMAQTVFKTHWNRQQFKRFTESLKKRGLISSLKTYQQGEKPPESLNLHQVPFKQGMFYVGSSEVLGDDQIELVHSLAEAFSVAYARYEDFVKLEEAKKSIENTLVELKSAQNQLIHAEKMASLGELTAGIAHEIQNPLNFVNNFSEVSGELIAELKEEIEAGNMEEALEIGQDLIQNIEKINHHGKRASSIVRGMLQHSRSGSDQKAPTDINYLADEYLRLAYHGFRAKDKSFNVKYKTVLAKELPKIDVVPQDIGRVLLNLINNAFQAVRQVDKPEVVVATSLGAKGIEIAVKDNGPGIPDDIKEKIFQPFFTTKPAGEGTGLGLSLSYDIVTKGHGGTIEIDSSVNKGSIFKVTIPV